MWLLTCVCLCSRFLVFLRAVFRFCVRSAKSEIRVVVLGAIGWMGRSQLLMYPPKTKVDAKNYVRFLKSYIFPSLRPLYAHTTMVWQQVPALIPRLSRCCDDSHTF